MTPQEITAELKKYNIVSTNTREKKSFINEYGDVCVSFYAGELREDFYFYVPFYDRIYKLPFTPDYKDRYPAQNFLGKDPKYAVPEVCWQKLTPKAIEIKTPVEKWDYKADGDISEMTIRDLYAIVQNKPVSKKEWINKMIAEKC